VDHDPRLRLCPRSNVAGSRLSRFRCGDPLQGHINVSAVVLFFGWPIPHQFFGQFVSGPDMQCDISRRAVVAVDRDAVNGALRNVDGNRALETASGIIVRTARYWA
jgi:hypothetical protein